MSDTGGQVGGRSDGVNGVCVCVCACGIRVLGSDE